MDSTCDQLMVLLDFIKLDMQANGSFAPHKSAIASAFRLVFGFDLDKYVFILQWLKGQKVESSPRPRHCPGEDGLDVGANI